MCLILDSEVCEALEDNIQDIKEAAKSNKHKSIEESVTYRYYDETLYKYETGNFYMSLSTEYDKIRINLRLSIDINKSSIYLQQNRWFSNSITEINDEIDSILENSFNLKKEDVEILSLKDGGKPGFNIRNKSKGSNRHTEVSYYGQSNIPFRP